MKKKVQCTGLFKHMSVILNYGNSVYLVGKSYFEQPFTVS